MYMGVILHAHPIRGESHIQRNVNEEIATTFPPFYNELYRSHVLLVKSAPGTTFTSWSQHHLSGKCAKLHTVAGSNNRDHLTRSLYYCLFVPHLYGCCSSRASHSWWITHSTERQPRGCNTICISFWVIPLSWSWQLWQTISMRYIVHRRKANQKKSPDIVHT